MIHTLDGHYQPGRRRLVDVCRRTAHLYSHSIVAGGLLVASRNTASTPGSSRIASAMRCKSVGDRLAKLAVIPSTELTGRRMTLSPPSKQIGARTTGNCHTSLTLSVFSICFDGG